MNINKSFRLDSVAAARLEELAKTAKMSQTALLEELITLCYSEAMNGYQIREEMKGTGFGKFIEAMNYRNFVNSKI